MKCKKCKTKNINQANYCKNCGNKFTLEEQKKAKVGTLVWFLELADNIKRIYKLEFITDTLAFKIASVVVILAIGVFSWINNGIDLKLLKSDDYRIQYNTEDDEYYLLVSDVETTLNLYYPNRTEELTLKHYDSNDEILSEENYTIEDEIVIRSDESNSYFILEAKYSNDKTKDLKLYLYREEFEE